MPHNVDAGNRVEITLDREEKTHTFISVVEDIFENNLVLMHMPISYGNLIKLPMNFDYKMMFYTEKGMFKYSARIIKFIEQGNFHFMLVELCSDAEKFQRREYFRYDCIIEFKYDTLTEEEITDGVTFDTIIATGVIKDISAGGIRFMANEDISENAEVKFAIPLRHEMIYGVAKVIAKQNFPKSNYKFQYRAEFVGLDESKKDIIVKFIFEEQRKSSKK